MKNIISDCTPLGISHSIYYGSIFKYDSPVKPYQVLTRPGIKLEYQRVSPSQIDVKVKNVS